jgi:putative effector of murein hydrolase LrgA (UPF0299 family)
MSTFGIILLIIALTSIFMALVLIPIKDGVVSMVFLFAALVCMLLITVETAENNNF